MQPFFLYMLATVLFLYAPQRTSSMPYFHEQLNLKLTGSNNECGNGRCNEQLNNIALGLVDMNLVRGKDNSINRPGRETQVMPHLNARNVNLETGNIIRRYARDVRACSPDCDK